MEKPILFNTAMVRAILEGRKTQTRRLVKPQGIKCYKGAYSKGYILSTTVNSMYCADILWVRETWQESECFDFHVKGKYAYLANDYENELSQEYKIKWRPSIHMPRAAARLFLRVTNVRVERLQDITPDDCEKEGMDAWIDDGVHDPGDAMYLQFKNLWDSVYKKQDFGWDVNPWVWVIDFERVTA